MKQDPVCRMEVKETEAVTAECDGIIYYFCSEGCRDKFLKDRTCARTAYDLIIVGGGPAGLTAAVYAATLKMEALIITKDLGGQAVDSTKIENYMGFDFITGPELIDKFRAQLFRTHYLDHLLSEVEKIETHNGEFQVTTTGLKTFSAKVLLIAAGMTRRKLRVPGEEEFLRKGVFYGNLQELSLVENKTAAVIGGGNSALQIVENLGSIAKEIDLVSSSALSADQAIIDRITCLPNLRVWENFTVVEFTGNKNLEALKIRKIAGDETITLSVTAVFVAIGMEPNSSLVAHLVEVNQRREIVIKADCSTSRAGIFAAGDVTNAYGKRIIIAAGEGAKAALAVRQYLLNMRKKVCW